MKFIKIVLVVIILASIPYYKTVVYNFQIGTPFTGNKFYNPYEKNGGEWIKANFHAHTKMHFGFANGENEPEEMFYRYDSLNYGVSGISNYNSILPNCYNQELYIPIYEHGLNFGTIHQLVINASYVNRYDYLFYQNKNHKQAVINKQKDAGQLVVLAHPSFKNGYSKKEMQLLNNYDLFEGLSVRASSIELWDEALSYGHAVWITGSDDAHDKSEGHTGVCWTMVNVASKTKKNVMQALESGAFYAQRGWQAQEMNRIKKVSVNNDIYTLELNSKADSIILKSDFGQTVAVATNANDISYNIKPENTYVRAEIFETEPWNTYTKIYLNPVIRTKDSTFEKHNNENSPNLLKTWIVRILILIINILMLFFIFKTPRKKTVETN